MLGKEIQFNRKHYKIIGVMPKDFGYPLNNDVPYESSESKQTDVWLPASYSAKVKTDRENFRSADAIGRLRDGISPAAAQAELAAIESRLQPLYPEMWRGWTVLARPLIETIVGPVEKMLWLLMGAVGIVLLIAISNLANLLLARSSARAHELGIRTALGAERSRIIRQLLTESLVLSVLGGAVGIGLAYATVGLLTRLDPGGIPRFDSASVDGRVLLIAVLLAILTGALAGIAPAISASRTNVNELLKQGGKRIAGGANGGRMVLIVMEVGLSVLLLTGSGLLIRSYLHLVAVNPGFSPSTLTFELNLDDRYSGSEAQRALYKAFLDKLRTIPGVRVAGASTVLPLTDHESVTSAEIRGYGHSMELIENRQITTDYLKAIGTPLLRGRDFNSANLSSQELGILVNQRFADMYFHGKDAIGGQVRTGIGDLSKTKWSTIIGIVGNVHTSSMAEVSQPMIIQPSDSGDSFALRCDVPTAQVIREARAVLRCWIQC